MKSLKQKEKERWERGVREEEGREKIGACSLVCEYFLHRSMQRQCTTISTIHRTCRHWDTLRRAGKRRGKDGQFRNTGVETVDFHLLHLSIKKLAISDKLLLTGPLPREE